MRLDFEVRMSFGILPMVWATVQFHRTWDFFGRKQTTERSKEKEKAEANKQNNKESEPFFLETPSGFLLVSICLCFCLFFFYFFSALDTSSTKSTWSFFSNSRALETKPTKQTKHPARPSEPSSCWDLVASCFCLPASLSFPTQQSQTTKERKMKREKT